MRRGDLGIGKTSLFRVDKGSSERSLCGRQWAQYSPMLTGATDASYSISRPLVIPKNLDRPTYSYITTIKLSLGIISSDDNRNPYSAFSYFSMFLSILQRPRMLDAVIPI